MRRYDGVHRCVPLRILTSETTSAWKGVLVFAVVWAVLVGLGLAVEALVR